MKTKNCESCFIIIDQIKSYFIYHQDEFANMVLWADNYNNCLGDDRLIPMSELDIYLDGLTPEKIIERAFHGYDSGSQLGFNPNYEYFYFNGYGNLVSVRESLVDTYYAKFIDRDHVEAIFEVWDNEGYLSYGDDDELDKLFLALADFVED